MRLLNLFLIAAAGLVATERLTFEGGVVYADRPKASSFSITLIIPGSQQESSRIIHDSLKEEILSMGQAPVTLEKRGAGEGEVDVSLLLRIEDHLLLVKKLQEGLVAGWNGKLFLLGQGDGGRIGAALAARIEGVEAIALIASGGLWAPQQEALHSFRSELAGEEYSPQYIHGFLVQAKQQFAQALKTPNPAKKAFGYDYKYWESLFKTNLAADLSQLSCPIYTVNGELDERVPIESVEALSERMKEKLTFRKKKKAGRELLKDREIYEEAIAWLRLNQGEF